MENKQFKQKKLYTSPTFGCIHIDKDISLILQSQLESLEPVWGPGEDINPI